MRISDSVAENLLKASGKYSKKQLADLQAEALKTKRPLQDIIIQKGLLTETQLTEAYANELGLPFIELTSRIPHRALNVLPEHVASRYKAVVFDIDESNNALLVAMTDPHDEEARAFLQKQLGDNVRIHVVPASQLKRALEQYRNRSSSAVFHVVTDAAIETDPHRVDTLQLLKGAPAKDSIAYILERALRDDASDIHIEPRVDHTVIRFRVDGLLREALKLPAPAHSPLIHYVKESTGLVGEGSAPQSGSWTVSVGDRPYNLRTSILPTVEGEKVVIHVQPQSAQAPDLRRLGLWGEGLRDIKKAVTQHHGAVLVTGPVGSGVSMTLFSILSALSSPHISIVTVEDPIEYPIEGATQVSADPTTDLTLHSGLQAALGQDPNIIMVSELNSTDTASVAMHAALHGHLLFSSLHTDDASSTIRRLLDMGIEPHVLASGLNAIIGQRLARRLCLECREARAVDAATLKEVEQVTHLSKNGGFQRLHELERQALDDRIGVSDRGKTAELGSTLASTTRGISHLWQAHKGGCEYCNHTGYKGRIGLFEVLVPSAADVQKAIMHSATNKTIHQAALSAGMISMQLDGLVKALRGQTTLAEVRRVTS